ncbi:pyrimidine reductase, riboflavin biosynthesis [Saccharomonospora marina XMU15]|uniref:Pyrimidine reductase, riboflavin biosynthesis n=1 Tax=Saccharomonospora marina XMU15 TaxID=882083 RepID=H5X3U3_9PSEU|nr:RibD family protein [Saccharomonospora marina]EHR52161.1 pyrimidine reductase, riboflavin biosynthesis [Saccharomonospora marina XMU15]
MEQPPAGPPSEPAANDSAPVGRAFVVSHNAASVDGRLAISPGMLLMFDERWPTYAGSTYADVQRRHRPGAILEGAGSLVREDDVPAPLPAATEPAEVLLNDYLPPDVVGRTSGGWLSVVDSRGRIRWLYKEYPGEQWKGWHVLVLVSRSTPLSYLAYLRREEIPYLVVGEERVDLSQAMSALRQRLGVRTVVSTAGARLNGAMLRAGLLDEIEVEVVPIAVGGTTTPTMFTAADLAATDTPTRLRLLGVTELREGRVLLRYAVEEVPQ